MKNINNYSLGIDIGSSSVKIAVVDITNNKVEFLTSKAHNGNISKTMKSLLQEISNDFANSIQTIALSGTGGNENISRLINDCKIKEVLCVPSLERACEFLYPHAKTILEIGAQNARYIKRKSENNNFSFAVSEGCASGTGAFLEQQVSRVGLNLESYQDIMENNKKAPTLSGHCSVFTKTDIIHRQQEGFTAKEILAGLCFATVRNIKTNLIKEKSIETPLVLAGAVSNNQGIIQALIKSFHLNESDIIHHKNTVYLQAIGTALLAEKEESKAQLSTLLENLERNNQNSENSLLRIEKLKYQAVKKELPCIKLDENKVHHCILGIDVGSTSVNLVLINENKELVSSQYLRTAGKPKEIVLEGIANIKQEFGNNLIIDEIGVTGSGRNLIGKMLNAQTIKDEITAQAKSAVFINPQVDTVFEIGGQDSKYISIANGEVVDFQMNKICAAGTGSFLEEQAKYLDIDINDYAKLALEAENPIELGERCTVFIESNISSSLALGVDKKDILAGLCHSVIRNYLGKVVGKNKVGGHILLQGGVCYNDAVIAAFQSHYGDKIQVSPIFNVSGAFGVALLALESKELQKNTVDRNTSIIEENRALFEKSKEYLTTCCKQKHMADRKSVGIPMSLMFYRNFPMLYTFFDALGFNVVHSGESDNATATLSQEFSQTDTCYPIKLAHGHIKKLVDMNLDYILLPRFNHKKNEITKQANTQERAQKKSENNKPIIKNIIQKSLPHLIDILPANIVGKLGKKMMSKGNGKEEKTSSVCPFMQAFPEIIKNSALNQGNTEYIELDMADMMSSRALVEIGIQFGKSKKECQKAADKAFKAFMSYMLKTRSLQESFLKKIKDDEKVLVIVTRFYNLADKILEMGIVEELLKSGYKVISSSHLPLKDMAKKQGKMSNYPFGHHMLVAAEFIKNNPNYYPIYLTNHGCGQDTMIAHQFLDTIGDKACLTVEIDEHFSKVGLVTRIEAFLNAISHQPSDQVKANSSDYTSEAMRNITEIKNDHSNPLYIPYLFPYSALLAKFLRKQDYVVHELPPQDEKLLNQAYNKCNSKEYLSFVFNLMDSIYLQNNNLCGSLLLQSNKQSDADAMYAQIIAQIASENITITSLCLEELFATWKNGKELFYSYLAGDCIMTAPRKDREKLLNNVIKLNEITEDSVIELAKNIENQSEKKIMLIGEPKILFNQQVEKNMIACLEDNTLSFQYMPMSEYLLYFSKNICVTDKNTFENSIDKVSKILAKNSPFTTDFNILNNEIEKQLPHYQASNGKYRFAKALNHMQCDGIVHLSSLHENTQTVLSSFKDEQNKNILSLSFDGRDYATQKEKLQSFIYYACL